MDHPDLNHRADDACGSLEGARVEIHPEIAEFYSDGTGSPQMVAVARRMPDAESVTTQ
jgi:hypothetical protein